jgi:PleD family two-component response regulator
MAASVENMDDVERQEARAPVVLVVDDDRDVREILREVLEQAGYVVAEAENGIEAIAYLEQHARPTAILLDLSMPVMDGWQCAAHIQSWPTMAAIPILVLTAREAHWGYPSPRVLRKPLETSKLLRGLEEARLER